MTTLDHDTAIMIMLAMMALAAVAALIAILVLYRNTKRAYTESKAESENVSRHARAVIEAERAIVTMRERIDAERRSPVPDLTLIRNYERQVSDLEKQQREAVESPWGPVA
jgi:hypothetical protein